jgi:hypothetical protein
MQKLTEKLNLRGTDTFLWEIVSMFQYQQQQWRHMLGDLPSPSATALSAVTSLSWRLEDFSTPKRKGSSVFVDCQCHPILQRLGLCPSNFRYPPHSIHKENRMAFLALGSNTLLSGAFWTLQSISQSTPLLPWLPPLERFCSGCFL